MNTATTACYAIAAEIAAKIADAAEQAACSILKQATTNLANARAKAHDAELAHANNPSKDTEHTAWTTNIALSGAETRYYAATHEARKAQAAASAAAQIADMYI